MNEEDYLVLIKGVDKTAQIQSYEVKDSRIWITYQSSSKPYPCAQRDFVILQKQTSTPITNEMTVYCRDMPLRNVKLAIDFGSKIKMKFNNNSSCVYDTDSIRIENNDAMNPDAKGILHYLQGISHYVGITEERGEEAAFLEKQLNRLTFISPSSVLSCYLKGSPLRMESESGLHTIFPFRFNLSQKEALSKALCSQVSIIEGPPGTGKTQTILNILANLVVMQNKKVAVVSGNNAAVQNVWDKLEEKGYHFLAAALGNADNKKKFFANLPYQDVSDWKSDTDEIELSQHIKEIDDRLQRLMELERNKAELKQRLSAYQLEQEHFQTYYEKQNIEPIGKLSFYRQTPDKILSFLADSQLAVKRGTTNHFLYKLQLLFRHGIYFNRLKDRELEAVLNVQKQYYELKIKQLTEQMMAIERELSQHSFQPLLSQHQQYSEQLFRHKLYQKYVHRQPIRGTAQSYQNHFSEFLDQYPIMLSTTHSLRNCVPADFLFDYVIIDESSQVDLLTAALALSCCKNAIIVGDIKQLPQIVDERIEGKINNTSIEPGGPYDYFRHNLLSSMLKLYGSNVPRVMLREHYRCHPKIIEYCNKRYYGGQLIAFTAEEAGDNPLLIYRTAAGNHMRELTHGRKGKFNQRELDVIEQEVLLDLEAACDRHDDIGITTPYRKQVDKASEQLSGILEVDTVHKYQGREKSIMILSSVLDSSRAGKRGLKFVNDPCLINVAVSRAQHKFILVTDHSLFRQHGNEIGDLIRYMEYSTVDDNIVESEIVSVFDLLYKDYSKKLKGFEKRIGQRSKYKSENIVNALLEEIVYESPYNTLEIGTQVLLGNLFGPVNRLEESERRYIKNRASVDFVLYNRFDKSPVLAVEVDGFAFHENNPAQLVRDGLKDNIFRAYGLPLLRLSTNGSGEKQKITAALDSILQR